MKRANKEFPSQPCGLAHREIGQPWEGTGMTQGSQKSRLGKGVPVYFSWPCL